MSTTKTIEYSYGIIPIRMHNDITHVLMLRQTNRSWSFPKGHAEPGESEHDAAQRELKEETGLEVTQFLDLPSLHSTYEFMLHGTQIQKHLTLYPAHVQGEITLQPEEISEARWMSLGEAKQIVYFPSARQVIDDLENLLITYVL